MTKLIKVLQKNALGKWEDKKKFKGQSIKSLSLCIVFIFLFCGIALAQEKTENRNQAINKIINQTQSIITIPKNAPSDSIVKEASQAQKKEQQLLLVRSGCCSHHGGVCGCDENSGMIQCCDGTLSPSCTCNGY